MTRMRLVALMAFAGAALLRPGAAHAQAQAQEPHFCPNRPSLGSSACTTLPGRVQVEASVVDWERTRENGGRQDTFLIGDFQARLGIGPSTEVQVNWTPFVEVDGRDPTGVERARGVGDVRLGLRQNLRRPDGHGLSIAVEPFVTLPAGRSSVSDGDWGGGAVIPVNYELGDRADLGLTGELDAAVDADGSGRHFAGSLTTTIGFDLTDRLNFTVEAQVLRDNDPAGRSTQTFAAGGLAYQPASARLLFLYGIVGLNRLSPDLRLLTGFAAAF